MNQENGFMNLQNPIFRLLTNHLNS